MKALQPCQAVCKLITKLLHTHPLLLAWQHKLYAVGGYTRQTFLGLPLGKDLDLIVTHPQGAASFSQALHGLFPRSTRSPRALGKGYPMYRLPFMAPCFYEGEEFPTTGAQVDLVDSQGESFPSPTSRSRLTHFASLEEDLARRDFTINMLVQDLTTQAWKDPCGNSVADLTQGVLQGHPQANLEQMFSDDPLRLLRLVRFHAQFGYDVPLQVRQAAQHQATRLGIVPLERLREEGFKILRAPFLGKAFELMKKLGLWTVLLPEMNLLSAEAWTLTAARLQKAPPDLLVQGAALLAEIPRAALPVILKRLGLSQRAENNLLTLLQGTDSLAEASPKALRSWMHGLGGQLPKMLDWLGLLAQDPDSHKEEHPALAWRKAPQLLPELRHMQRHCFLEHPLLGGKAVMECLLLSPGPEVQAAIDLSLDLEERWKAVYGKRPPLATLTWLLKAAWPPS